MTDDELMQEVDNQEWENPWLNNPWYALGAVAGDRIRVTGEEPGEPLSGEWAGYSIPEIFGSWEEATEEAMEAYEAGYWSVFD